MDLKEQLKSLSVQDRKELLKQLQQEEKENKRNRRDAYEGLRAQFMLEVKNRLFPVVDDVKAFRDWVEKEAASFRDLMRDGVPVADVAHIDDELVRRVIEVANGR